MRSHAVGGDLSPVRRAIRLSKTCSTEVRPIGVAGGPGPVVLEDVEEQANRFLA